MIQTLFLPLFELVAGTCALFLVHVLAEAFLPRHRLPAADVARRGLAFVAAIATSLWLGVQLAPGVFVDARGGVIAAATLVLGIPGGLVVAAAGIAIRWLIGGDGAVIGTLSMLGHWGVVAAIVLAFRRWAGALETARVSWRLLSASSLGVAAVNAWAIYQVGGRTFDGETPGALLALAAGAPALSTLLLGGLARLDDNRLRALRESEASHQALERALVQTVEALAAAVLHRDPATSQHQRRVADLAVAVGRELGLDESHLRGLELACLVHDVGQIELPGEILSRPGKLSAAELELVKLHAEVGHSMLENVAFPWPLAETVYQRHENLDGTGYPRALRGDEICRDARILRACDIVEAMSSHRPFKNAPGIEAALREIEGMAGRQLDPAVVRAIVALFRDGRYAWPAP